MTEHLVVGDRNQWPQRLDHLDLSKTMAITGDRLFPWLGPTNTTFKG